MLYRQVHKCTYLQRQIYLSIDSCEEQVELSSRLDPEECVDADVDGDEGQEESLQELIKDCEAIV